MRIGADRDGEPLIGADACKQAVVTQKVALEGRIDNDRI